MKLLAKIPVFPREDLSTGHVATWSQDCNGVGISSTSELSLVSTSTALSIPISIDIEQSQVYPQDDFPKVIVDITDEKRKPSPTPSVNPLDRTGVPFGGVFRDLKSRLPYYMSDFYDALNLQCLTSMVFMFFAAFAPAITFGGLMGNYTKDAMGITETLLAQCICGIIWGLFSAQPMLIMSATGPVLIFEASLYSFCDKFGLDFLTVRVWAGIWLVLIALITVAFEGSFLIKYITRFTEDIFAVLISAIFIAEGIKFIIKTFETNPVMNMKQYATSFLVNPGDCSQKPSYPEVIRPSSDPNDTLIESLEWAKSRFANQSVMYRDRCKQYYQPDTALLTAILVVATFTLAYYLKKLRTSHYLGRTLRRAIGDFGVLISIVVVSLFDILVFKETQLRRVDMPASFGFTNTTARGGEGVIFISADLGDGNWLKGIGFALVPALLVYILLFVETEITELLLNSKERGLRKGSGFHWDLLLVGFLALLCSFLGLPWMCAAAVQSLAHASSLTVMKRHAPGERPQVDFVIEQRVTTIGVAVLVGVCAFAGKFLQQLPLCVLFGVFLYLGVMNLLGVQFLSRIVLFFIPEKYFPDFHYCQNVRMWRMHLFTAIQLACLVGVYVVKHFPMSSLVFPFVLMFATVIRIFILPKVFSETELKALDGHEESDEDDDEKDLYEEVHGMGL